MLPAADAGNAAPAARPAAAINMRILRMDFPGLKSGGARPAGIVTGRVRHYQ
jgi:hypothetical protein